MTRTMKRIGTAALATAAVVTGTVVAGASPAAAATQCNSNYQSREFPTPGYDVDFKIKLCIGTVSGGHVAFALGEWGDGGALSRKFDLFNINLRIERYDASKGASSCSLKNAINLYDSGTFGEWGDSHNESSCYFRATSGSDLDGGWSADGTITYDIDGDGKGVLPTWNLAGSPVIN